MKDLTIFPKKIYKLSKAYEKILHITNHQGNAKENHGEIVPYTCQNSYYQKDKK